MPFEEEYEDVLQNIEFAVVAVYRRHPDMTDWDALSAIESLIHAYSAEAQGIRATPRNLTGLSTEVAQSVRAICEWRLGRETVVDQDGHIPVLEDGSPLVIPPKSLDEILACLKRIRRSIQLWNKRGGRQGYLAFVSRFLP